MRPLVNINELVKSLNSLYDYGEIKNNTDLQYLIDQNFIRLAKDLSRKKLGSKNWEKTRLLLAKTYEKLANQRRDYFHKLSSKIIHENQVIVLEDLNEI